MARPLTERASFVQISVKIPPELRQVLRNLSDKSGRPFQTEVIRALQRGLRDTAEDKQLQQSSL